MIITKLESRFINQCKLTDPEVTLCVPGHNCPLDEVTGDISEDRFRNLSELRDRLRQRNDITTFVPFDSEMADLGFMCNKDTSHIVEDSGLPYVDPDFVYRGQVLVFEKPSPIGKN